MTAQSQADEQVLRQYLRSSREALLWKIEGVSERELRLPRTATGTNLLGIVKHCLNVEAGYFGPTFGRALPMADELIPLDAYDVDPQVDFYATETETAAVLVDLYRRVGQYVDDTLAELPFDTVGLVPWWPEDLREVTLQRIVVHVLQDLARHAGHADILREQLDSSAGHNAARPNLPDDYDWPAYVARLTANADRFA